MKTSSEVLISVLEQFSKSEARGVVVIWMNEDGQICFNFNESPPMALGMIELCHALLLSGLVGPGPQKL